MAQCWPLVVRPLPDLVRLLNPIGDLLLLAVMQQRDDIRDIPQPIRDASGHRRSNAKRLVNANEVVVLEVQRDRCDVILKATPG
jgi:hypothetical protein